MHWLSEIQSDFAGAVQDPDAPVPTSLRRASGGAPERRFNVYRNNVAASMTEALRATFPAVERLVGAEFFAAAARVYLKTEPPKSPLLFRYGGSFGAFLDGFPPAASVPYLGDVARLEWARLQAYHAADRTPLGIAGLSEIPPSDVGLIRFELHPSLTLIDSKWPVVSLWAASTDRGSPDHIDLKHGEQATVIRPDLDVDTRVLPAGGAAFIAGLLSGETLEQAANAAASSTADFDLATHLQGLFDLGAVIAVKLPQNGNANAEDESSNEFDR